MGSIYSRKETGKLVVDFRYLKERCREQTEYNDTKRNRNHLEILLFNIEREIREGRFDYAKFFPLSAKAKKFTSERECTATDPIFKLFTLEWWNENSFRWKQSGKKNNRSILDKHLLPTFGEISVSHITKGDILKFRAMLASQKGRLGKTLSNKRINNILQPLKCILDEAAERFGFTSPFITIKRLTVSKAEVLPLSLSEVTTFLTHVHPFYQSYFCVRFFTGLRTGEIDGLRWKNVDFTNHFIYVKEAFCYGVMDKPKTLESIRDIKMSKIVEVALRNQRQKMCSASEFVFCNSSGFQLDQANVNKRIWYPTLQAIGLEKRRPYQTRHTAATLWLASGENPEWIARQLGHATTEMLFKTYSRFVPNATRQDGSAFERLLAQHSTKETRNESHR